MDKKYTTIEIYTESTPKQLIRFNRTHPELKRKTFFNKMINLQNPLDKIPLSKNQTQIIFLPNTEAMTLQLIHK